MEMGQRKVITQEIESPGALVMHYMFNANLLLRDEEADEVYFAPNAESQLTMLIRDMVHSERVGERIEVREFPNNRHITHIERTVSPQRNDHIAFAHDRRLGLYEVMLASRKQPVIWVKLRRVLM
jgi:hypothetical protein